MRAFVSSSTRAPMACRTMARSGGERVTIFMCEGFWRAWRSVERDWERVLGEGLRERGEVVGGGGVAIFFLCWLRRFLKV